MKRTLILVRHAHRETDGGRDRDNGLSPRGKVQAKFIARYFRMRFPKQSPVLLSSPKLRCIETLFPLSDKLGIEMKVLDLIAEQEGTTKSFILRVEKFLRWWKTQGPPLLVVCSHGDWIPQFTQKAVGAAIELKKGGWAELEIESSQARLRWLLQKVPRHAIFESAP
jgi:phosphohistidine phosphatase SixA